MAHPKKIFIITGCFLLATLIPVKNLTLIIPQAESLPADYESRITFEEYETTFGQQRLYPAVFLFEDDEKFTNKHQWNDFQEQVEVIKKHKLVDKTESILDLVTHPNQLKAIKHDPRIHSLINENKTLVFIYFKNDPLTKETKDWVKSWDKEKIGSLQITVGGMTKYQQEMLDEIKEKAPYALALVLISTYVILLFAFRSVLLPLKAIFMNILSLLSAFGILIWIFNSDIFVEPADVGIMVPVFALSLVFGLSMDYEVFLLSKIHEEYVKSGDNDSAVLRGLTETSAIITSAGLIMMVITGAFAFTEVLPIKQIGIAIFIAILIDGTFIRLLFVPSFMKLMGKWNWWFPR